MVEQYSCYSWVEDAVSAAVARKLVAYRNEHAAVPLLFKDGFPATTGGNMAIKAQCPKLLHMAERGLITFAITDLDVRDCAMDLLLDWFGKAMPQPRLPDKLIFRIAVREVEAWLLADRDALAAFFSIPAANFSENPETLPDPKKHLLGVLQRKGRRKIHREMLPLRGAHIGPRYNETLTKFVAETWSPERAASSSESLRRAIAALQRL